MKVKKNGIIFLVAFVLAFAGGYLFFNQNDDDKTQTESETAGTTETVTDDEKKPEVQATAEYEILNTNSCLACHAVNSLEIEGGTTGPDLSNAYEGVKDKHGIELDAFLKEPTSAVMSGVIEGSPLSDEDRADIIEVLKKASEK